MTKGVRRLKHSWEDGGRTAAAGLRTWGLRLRQTWADERGASAIEYALLAAMVAVALVAFVTPLRTAVTSIFTSIQTALTSAAGGGN